MSSGASIGKPAAVITGAAGGMASTLAAGFRTAGYDVTAVDRAAGERVESLDVTDTAAVEAFSARFERLHVLINAAGVLLRHDEFQPETFSRVVDINLTGGLRLATSLKSALAAARGSIINVASMYAYFGAPHAPAYAASKGGVVQLTKSLAVAWAPDGIRVNAVAPGWIVTPMTVNARGDAARNAAIIARTPMGRWGTPEDVLGPMLFLASDAARFVTGVVLPVDGGYSVA
jgi:NAD(P)-dependent dehydrogenase (short-subunit alcohol dehydrogenase family)